MILLNFLFLLGKKLKNILICVNVEYLIYFIVFSFFVSFFFCLNVIGFCLFLVNFFIVVVLFRKFICVSISKKGVF